MVVTLKQIARKVGVTETAVSHALRDKPLGKRKLAEKTAQNIRKVAEEMGYKPNKIGKALANKRDLKIAVVIFAGKDKHYCNNIMKGVHEAKGEYSHYGLSLSTFYIEETSPKSQAKIIDELADEKVDGICASLIYSSEVSQAIDRVADIGIPVITFGNDLPKSKRLCFIGSDHFKSGQIAADLLCNFIGGEGKVFVLSGFNISSGHSDRINGFRSVVNKYYRNIKIIGVEEDFDDDEVAFQKTSDILETEPDLAGIYVATGVCAGVARVVNEHGKKGSIKIVSHDLFPETVQFIKDGLINSTIVQDPAREGKLSVELLFNFLFNDTKPNQEFYPTKIEIYTKHLVDASREQ